MPRLAISAPRAHRSRSPARLIVLLSAAPLLNLAAPLTLTLPAPPVSDDARIILGEPANPRGSTLTVNARSLVLDGQPWTPVMGEFHYSRYPAAEWREELLKMKAGGIDIVATYVFWIHHEEIAGRWNWSGQRDLRRFIETVQSVGLKAIVRCGPWCHGEVRNGGLPDWLVARGPVRSNDPDYLEEARILYREIAAQVKGLLWKDGGPVIGVQLENEYSGPAEHLLTLKQLAREAGLDVPLYTRTGWPDLQTPLPHGEILPLYGVYAEGFWDRELSAMPGNYWAGFHFSTLRTDANIANEALGRRDARDAPDIARYPYLTCEIGGGMMSSYHRRIRIDPRDIDATTLVKLGSGSNSPGYYMYHGGTNPTGLQSTLMEEQATAITNWNDMPVKNYDFQAPLGQYGQVRPQYHRLRRLHYFLREHGSALARMPVTLPDQRPTGKDDRDTLRWAVRSDGHRGFVFVNNYERLQSLPAKPGVQFTLSLADGSTLTFPVRPVTVPADAAFIWPFHLDLGGVTLLYATAQPLTHVVDEQGVRTLFFAETSGVPAEFAFVAKDLDVEAFSGELTREADGRTIVRNVTASRGEALRLTTPSVPSLRIVVLNETDSLGLWKGEWQGRNRLVLTPDNVVFEGDTLRLTSVIAGPRSLSVLPLPRSFEGAGASQVDGVFHQIVLHDAGPSLSNLATEQLRPAGPVRTISPGRSPQPVAAAPVDADFKDAAVWKIKLPKNDDALPDLLLRIHYVGDVARVMIGDRLVMDDYYNGEPLEIGLRRHAKELDTGELTIAILPLQKAAPIYLSSAEARPEFGSREAVARLLRVELFARPTIELGAK